MSIWNRIKEIMLVFVLILYVVPISRLILDNIYMPVIKYAISKGNYLRNVKGDPLMVNQIRDSLQQFNDLVPTNIVPTTGTRPIDIILVNDFVWNGFGPTITLGRARPTWKNCKIEIATEQIYNNEDLKNVVIHEYLHCFGYKHVDKLSDIMYKYLYKVDSKSITGYAKELQNTLK